MVRRSRLYVAAPIFAMVLAHSLGAGTCDRLTPNAECLVDDDCGLAPAFVSCCVECPPAPPFEAMTRTELDALWWDLESRCAESSSACVPVSCPVVPRGCVARAVCDSGRCRVIETGCEPRVAVVR